jgi:SpoVK/Ycf46/Vps4 family AAA+-type ATPase
MTYFLRNGSTFRPSDEANLDLHKALPVGNYIIKEDQFGNMFFETVDSFEFKGKRYGDNIRNSERILSTFLSRDASTGVMLTGEKGSGKSLLAKMISIEAAEQGIPTLIINAPWCGDKFNKFIQDIQQPCVVLFDEFEKVYDTEQQESILTLLDGVFPSKKLFMLTCNDKWRVDTHMRNRPGRIFYMIDFKGLSAEFIREYCEDNLNAKHHIDKIVNITSLFAQFNFDMLKALVEEMNRYNEAPEEALRMLNVKAEFDSGNKFNVDLKVKGKNLTKDMMDDKEWNGNPLHQPVNLEYHFTAKDSDGDEYQDWERTQFTHVDLVKVDANSGKFMFENKSGDTLTLTRAKEKNFNYYDAF